MALTVTENRALRLYKCSCVICSSVDALAPNDNVPWMEKTPLTIVLPCFNEEANIAAAVHDVMQWIESAAIDGEVIVVNDGSKDRSGEVLAELSKQHPRLKVLTHERNQGYGIAVRSGLDAGTKENIGFMDSDMQFHAKDFALLLPHLKDYRFVTGRRRNRADSLMRNAFGKILGGMNVLIFGLWVRDVNCGMKVMKRDIWQTIRPTYGVEKLFNTEVFLRLKRAHIPWKHIDIPHYPRTAGNPTGGSVRVILRMFKEMWDLRRKIS